MKYIAIILLLVISGCGVPPEGWHKTHLEEELMASMDASLEKWIVASQYLPREKLEGLYSAGFFEIGDSIYSHNCDSHGNMIRMKYDENGHTWKQIKYETHGCIDNTL